MTIALPTRKLGSTGIELTTLGFGGASIGNLYKAISDEQAGATINVALDVGIRYFDTAPHYGQGLSELRLGRALQQSSHQAPQHVVVSTKVGRVLEPIALPPLGTERWGFVDGLPYEPVFDYSYDGVMRSFESSLQRLQVSRVDILFAHDLGRDTHGQNHEHHWKIFLDGGYRAMCELKAQGVVRAIGLGVNEWQICMQALQHITLDVFLLAGRYTLLEQEALELFLPECVRRMVSVILGGPFNSGILINGVRGGNVPFYNYAPARAAVIARVQAIQTICDSHKVPLAAAALQFPLAHPAVISIIPGQASSAQASELNHWFQTTIPASLWTDLRTASLLHAQAPVPTD